MPPQKTPLQQKLEDELNEAPWALLAPHHARGGVWVVDPALPLVMVAMAVSQDCVDDVVGWVNGGQLARPTTAQVEHWAAVGQRFSFLIVQPYVLASPVPAADRAEA